MPVQSSSKVQRPAVPGTPALIPLGEHAGKPAILLNREITTVGSRHDARLHLLSRTVSKAHALIVVSPTAAQAYIRDLASRSHVYVNGKAVREVELSDGDLIKIGTFTFRYSSGGKSARAGSSGMTPAAHLEVDGADLPVPIADRVLLIGRRPTSDIALVEASVSTAHAALVEIDGKRFLRDLGSRTGTFVNGKRIRQIELSFGDQVRIGETEMRYTPVELSLDDLPGGPIEEVPPLASDFEPLDIAPADDSAENAVSAPTIEQPPASAEIVDEAQQLLVDANLRQEKLSSSATHTELQAEADKAIASARHDEPDITDLLAVDDKGTASPDDLLPQTDADEFEPRRGWRSKRAPGIEPPVADQPPTVAPQPVPQAPSEPEAVVEPPPVPQEPVEPISDVAPAAEDEVFRIPNEEDLNDAHGGTAVLDEVPEDRVDDAWTPFGAPEARDDQETPAIEDLGLSPRLAEMAEAHAPQPVEPAQPQPIAELETIDFSAMKFEPAADEPVEESSSAEEARVERPLIDLAPAEPVEEPAPPAVESRAEPLIAPDAIPAAEEQPSEQVVESPPAAKSAKRRAARRKRKVDSTVVSTTAPAPVAPPAPQPEPAPAESAAPAELDEASTIAFDAVPTDVEQPAAAPAEPPPPLELPVDAPSVEVLDKTEPTLESALDLSGAEIEAEFEAQSLTTTGDPVDLTDTTFSRAVEDFIGESTGPIVEESRPSLELSETQAPDEPDFEAPAPQDEPSLSESLAEAPPESFEPIAKPIIEEPEPLPIEQITQAPESPRPHPEAPPGFGADQAGFLGGAPLKLGNLAPPPRPRRTAPFGRKPLVDDLSDELPSAAFARGPFDVTPNDVATTAQQNEIPPYTGQNPTVGKVTTGFDGLAMPPVREADVFSQMFPSAGAASPDHAPLDLVVPESNVKRPTDRKSPASALDEPAEEFWGEDVPSATAEPAEEAVEAAAASKPARSARSHRPVARGVPAMPAAPVEAPPRRRKRWWSIRSLLVMMLLCMIAAAAGIYLLVPIRTLIVGSLKFSNFDELTEFDRQSIISRQKELLRDPELRTLAVNLFKKNHPQADAGFLSDRQRFGATVAGAEVPDIGDALSIEYRGGDPNTDADVQRVAALMTAIYNRNSALIDVRDRVQAQVQDLQRAIAATETEIARLESERDRLKPLFDNRPSAARLAQLQSRIEERKVQWNAAVTSVTHLKAEVDAMRRAAGLEPSTRPSDAAPAPATMPSAADVASDPQIAELQKNLDQASAQLAEQKMADAEKAQQARQELDATLEEFQRQIAAAKGSLQNNPELQSYLDEAQSLQQAMRKLTVELIDRQQEQHTRLTELKQRLDEKLQQRRSDAWQNDPQLREFAERLAMTRRAHNAALASGLEDEARDLEAKVKLLEEMVRSRQELVGQDALVTETVKQLEELIASTERQLADDRKSSDEMMSRLQRSFAQNQASKLPAEQQALARDLEQRIAELNAARSQYASALGESSDGGVDSKQLEAVVTDLRSRLEIRAAELERQNQQNATLAADGQSASNRREIENRQAELDAAQQAEAKAQATYFEIHNEYQDLQASVAQARAAGDKLDETIRELDVKKGQLQQQQDQLQAKTRELARASAPIAPTDNDVRVVERQDPRSMIILASWGGIALLFVITISLVSASSSRHEPPLADFAPVETDEASTDASSNGHANGDDAEHETPAEVARL